jgi:RNA methyltransferase, TrmH family
MKNEKKNHETRIYGLHACLKVFQKRPEDIIRAYFEEDLTDQIKPLLKYLAEHKKAYHIVDSDELDKITKATHHEKICLIIRPSKFPPLKEILRQPGPSLIICLEVVENPHNMGAILRTAAHFKVNALLYEAVAPVAQSASAIRTAEGGAEVVPTFQIQDWSFVFDEAKRGGYTFFATSSHQGRSLYQIDFPEKTILFLGAERVGLSQKLGKKMDHFLTIPGSGEVESLNVSNAATAFLSEWYRQIWVNG